MKTPTGTIRVSTPDATALDLVRFTMAAGHFGNVVMVLSERGERIDPDELLRYERADGIRPLLSMGRPGYSGREPPRVAGGGDSARLRRRFRYNQSMIAISFFDALACDDGLTSDGSRQRSGDLATLSKRYVESALADWQHVLECERQFGSTQFPTPAEQSRVNRSLYEVYQKWAAEAEQVLLRTRTLAAAGLPVEEAEALEHAFGRVQARLKMTPEMFDRAREQIRQGLGIPAEEVRNGLRGRVRA